MTQYTGDPEALNAQVRAFLAELSMTDEQTIAAIHALAFENGGDIDTAFADYIIRHVDATPHEPLDLRTTEEIAASGELQHDPKLRRRVFAYVLKQPNGTEAMAEDVYQLALAGVSMELAYRELSSTSDRPNITIPGDMLFEDAGTGDLTLVPGAMPEFTLDLSSLEALGFDFSAAVKIGDGGAIEIDTEKLLDAIADARPDMALSPGTRGVMGQILKDQLGQAAAEAGVDLNIQYPELSPNDRLQAVLMGWALKGLQAYDVVKEAVGRRADSIRKEFETMKEHRTELTTFAVQGLELSLRISAVFMLYLGVKHRKTADGKRMLQWASLTASLATVIGAAGRLSGVIPERAKPSIDIDI